jgi:hypothetical protein
LVQTGVHQRRVVGLYSGGPEQTTTSGVIGGATVVRGVAVVAVVVFVVAGNVVVVMAECDWEALLEASGFELQATAASAIPASAKHIFADLIRCSVPADIRRRW